MAVNGYKASLAFKLEVIEAYQLRFVDCKEVVLTCFPNLNLIGIEVPATEKGNAFPSIEDIAAPEASLAPNSNL